MTDDDLLAEPIIIVGSPRSGTTRLGELLAIHTTVHEVEEPRFTWRFGNDEKSDALKPSDARPEVIENIRARFAGQIRAAGKTRLVEKTPSNSLRLGFVKRVFPDARVVHITRNGIDAALSVRTFWQKSAHGSSFVSSGKWKERLREIRVRQIPHYAMEVIRRYSPQSFRGVIGQNLWGPRLPGLRELAEEMDLLEVAAIQWRTCIEAAHADGQRLFTDRFHELKLEELNEEAFRRVLDFAELPTEQAVVDNFNAVFDPSLATSRRSAATAEEISTLRKWIEPTMQWFDYAWPQSH